jgi:hypothetical protein
MGGMSSVRGHAHIRRVGAKGQSEMKTRFVQAGAMLAGAAVIATTMAIYPVAATNVGQSGTASKTKKCNAATPCMSASNAGSGAGLTGYNTGTGDGVDGNSDANNGLGGTTSNPSTKNGGRSGVYGVDASTDYGNMNVGVTGQSFGAGTGVRGVGATGVGVVGYSYSGIGMEGYSFGSAPGIEGTAFSESPAILAYGGSSNDSSGLSFEAVQYDGAPSFWVTNDGNAHVAGLIYTAGNCSKGCDRTRGERVVSYAAQTSFPTIEDVGEGRLAGGQAHIAIDAALSRAIDQGSYVVFVTPEGESRGLYVTDKTSTGFSVAENGGGHSNIAFGYRIVAKPYGVKAARLPITAVANAPHAVRPAR